MESPHTSCFGSMFRSKSQKRSRYFLDLFLFCLLGYVTYPPNPLSVKGAYGAESVVCTSDPKVPPVRGLGGVNKSSREMPANAGSSLVLSLIEAGKIDTTPLITHRYKLTDIGAAYHLFENKLDGVIKVAVEP